MFTYISKKITIPNNNQLTCISWNKVDDFIAYGGERGLLKVLKLKSKENTSDTIVNSHSEVNFNVSLEGHSGSVLVAVWNSKYQKLTTADSRGSITVWALHNGSWYEEMINNRNKSTINSMRWSRDGSKICIAYNDGMIIVGSVDGNKLWVTEVHQNIVTVEWSPRDRLIMLGTTSGEIHVYDSKGNFQSKIKVPGALTQLENQQLVCIKWANVTYDSPGLSHPRSLAIVFQQGYLQMLFNEKDKDPLTANLPIQVVTAKWNPDGTLLALLAQKPELPIGERSMIYFINGYAEPIHTLKVPGTEARDCSWGNKGLCLAIAVDSSIVVANIRAEYKWGFFLDTVVYSFKKTDAQDTCVAFWDSRLNEVHVKYVHRLTFIETSHQHALVVHSCEDDENKQYLEICNPIGNPVDFTFVVWKVLFAVVNSKCAVVADSDKFCVWYFKTISSTGHPVGSAKPSKASTTLCHIDDSSAGAAVEYTGPMNRARKSGQLCKYTFPAFRLSKQNRLKSRPTRMALNCVNEKLAYIDSSHMFRIFDLTTEGSEIAGFEKRDVWDFKWSSGDKDLLAVSEKNKIFIYKETESQIILQVSAEMNARICHLGDVVLQTIFLDKLIRDQEPTGENYFTSVNTKLYEEAVRLSNSDDLNSLLKYVESEDHPALWKHLAEEAMKRNNLDLAEHAFIKLQDYDGIQFLRSIMSITDLELKKAEIFAYLGDIKQAEKLYRDHDRMDLAISLHQRCGNWQRVLDILMEELQISNDIRLFEAYKAMGDYWADRDQWSEAEANYKQDKCYEKLAITYLMLEKYDMVSDLIELISDGQLLLRIAVTLANVGFLAEANAALEKWREGKDLEDISEEWKQISSFIRKHSRTQNLEGAEEAAEQPITRDVRKTLDMIQLYKRNKRNREAAKIIFQMAQREDVKTMGPLLMKQVYVLGALLFEMQQGPIAKPSSASRGNAETSEKAKRKTADDILKEEADFPDDYQIENPWRGAEVYHYYMLAQRSVHQGEFQTAMKLAIYISNFDHLIDPREVYSLMALTSCKCGQFNMCKKALAKLEELSENQSDSNNTINQYKTLASAIFAKYGTSDTLDSKFNCPICRALVYSYKAICPKCDSSFPICTLTGKTLLDNQYTWTCATCRHGADAAAMADQVVCPLCHSQTQ